MDEVCSARVHEYLRGGTEHFSGEREYADARPSVASQVRRVLQAERAFLTAAVEFMIHSGIRQFVDLGSGLPGPGGPLEVCVDRSVDACVVHVDSDPEVVEHSRVLLAGAGMRGHVLQADVADPGAVLTPSVLTGRLDLSHPVGVLAVGILPLVPDTVRAAGLLSAYCAALCSGSAVALTHLTP